MKGYYFVLLDDSGDKIKAGLPVFEVKSWLTGSRLVSIPFATLCDPLISIREDLGMIFESVLKLSKELKSHNIEIRTLQSSSIIKDSGLSSIRLNKHHYLHLENELDKLYKKFHRSCVRQSISRAIKSDLRLTVGETEPDLQDFYQLQLITRKRLGLPLQPYIFFKMLWEIFSPLKQIQLLFALKDERKIAGLLQFKFGERVSVEFAVSDERYRNLSPNHFLFWEAIKLAHQEGYKIFDFGRTSPSNRSLMEFKGRWGAKVIDLPVFLHPPEAADEIIKREETWKYRFVSKLCSSAPDSFQEAIGNFCYRHLG